MRFGHPSFDKLVKINNTFPFVHIVKAGSPWDTCFYAAAATTTKRLPFSLSFHAFDHIFYLVHMDIWGPLSVPSMYRYKFLLTIFDDKSIFTWIYLQTLSPKYIYMDISSPKKFFIQGCCLSWAYFSLSLSNIRRYDS